MLVLAGRVIPNVRVSVNSVNHLDLFCNLVWEGGRGEGGRDQFAQ